MTLSALTSTLGGIVTPICFAAFRLMKNWGQRALPRRDLTLYDHSMRVSGVQVRYGYTDHLQV